MPERWFDMPTIDTTKFLSLYKTMALVRQSEVRLSRLFADGEVPGFIHLSIGQEAVPAGIGAVLRTSDTIASTHRGHGHALAKGMPLDRFFLEIMGKEDGICSGRGGSMHVADLSIGMLGANGIVGAGIPIALGSALAHQTRGSTDIAAVFFGDGAMAEGVLHESLNLASLWKLPLLAVCENNGWAEFSPTSRQVAANLGSLSKAYGIPHEEIDGNDLEAVWTAADRIVAAIRGGGGPFVLECRTTRIRGHYEGDQQKYRDPIEALGPEDAVARARKKLADLGVAATELDEIESAIESRIDSAVEIARSGLPPGYARASRDVYASGGN
jgi:acetoin:2,6-dichlorophenolindophenol oxidoreductase subunit alpha